MHQYPGSRLPFVLFVSGRVGTAYCPNCLEVGARLHRVLIASRGLRPRVGARLRLDLLSEQGRGKATPLPILVFNFPPLHRP